MRLSTFLAAAAGVVAGMVFREPLRKATKSVAKSAVHGTADLREDLEDVQAEVANERAAGASAVSWPNDG